MRNVIIVFLIVILSACGCCDSVHECIALDGTAGECKLATECETIPFLRDTKRTSQQIEYLKKSSCGTYQGTIPELCCPLSPPILSVVQSTVQPAPTTLVTQSTPKNPSRVADKCLPTFLPPEPNSKCCGVHGFSPRIQGGSEAAINQYPWLVLLEYRDIDAAFMDTKCGGSLISGRYALTAAQCVDGGRTNVPESVRLGEYDTLSTIDCVLDDADSGAKTCNDGPVSVPIQDIIKHAQFTPGRHPKNDIALLRLTKMTTYNAFIRPICLPSTTAIATANATAPAPATAAIQSNLYVAGWGSTNTGHKNSIKMHVMIPFVNLTTCNPYYSHQLNESQICAGGEIGRDSCTGDAGGPLMQFAGRHYELIGIVSYGGKPCGSTTPGVYTNVMEYLEWITNNMLE